MIEYFYSVIFLLVLVNCKHRRSPGCLCANVLSDNFSVSQVYMFVLLIRSQLYVAAIIIVSLVKEILDLRGLTGFK